MMRGSVLMIAMLFGCGGDDGTTKPPATWQRLGERLPASLLAAWTNGSDDVWLVGGREGVGLGPIVFHYDGTAWAKLDTGMANVDLWQVFGFDDAVFFGGNNGTILRYQNGAFAKLTTPSTDTTFGLWGTSSSDVWAVGGQTTGKAFIWRLQGDTFVKMSNPELDGELATGGAVWKVAGRSANDVWMSASRGLVFHWDGQTLTSQRIGGTGEALFSIGCTATRCVTAGSNTTNGVLYEYESAWAAKTPTEDGPVLRGVSPTSDDVVVGQFGVVLRRTENGWVTDPHGLTTETLHAAWSDADGNLFAVGGKFDRAPTIDGVVLFKGSTELPALP